MLCTAFFVHFYTRIIAALSQEERGLFRERIRFLDKKIHPGLTKLTWASKGISDYFITECRMHASKVLSLKISCIKFKGVNFSPVVFIRVAVLNIFLHVKYMISVAITIFRFRL